MAVLVNGKLFAFVQVRINFTFFSDGMSPFFKIFGKSFVIIKFATEVFAKTTSSTVAEIIKLVIKRDLRYASLPSPFTSDIDVLEISVIKKKFVQTPAGRGCLKY